jgi:antitoxin VapB
MALSIRNQRAGKLTRKIAVKSGKSITQAIIHALEERLQQLRGRKKVLDPVEEIMKISKRCSQLPHRDTRRAEEILGHDRGGVTR